MRISKIFLFRENINKISCGLLEIIQNKAKINNLSYQTNLEDIDPAIRKLELISQELQFKIFFMKQIFLRKSDNQLKSPNETFGKFFTQNSSNFQSTLQSVVKNINDVKEIISNIELFDIDETNEKLKEKKQSMLNYLRIIQVKWSILEQLKDSILVQKTMMNELEPNILDLVRLKSKIEFF